MAKQNLEKFLKELAQDPKLMQRYKANPKKVMAEHGVDSAHQDLIMRGDNDGVQKALGATSPVPTTTIDNYKE